MSRSFEVTIEINAALEEVYRAVSEPEQIQKWFAPEVRIDPRVGGEYFLSWGEGMGATATISAWEPPTHFSGYMERSLAYGRAGQPPVETGTTRRIAVDYYIEAVSEGVTRLRLVQSGFGPEPAWDDEIESTKLGWATFLGKLKGVVERESHHGKL